MLSCFTFATFVLGAVFTAADRLEGRINLYLWRVMK
jgi:hypothetical protein